MNCFLLLLILSNTVILNGKKTTRGNSETRNGCSLTLPRDIPKSEPIYMILNHGNYSLYAPFGELNMFQYNSKLTLFCPGRNNEIRGVLENMTILNCHRDNRWGIGEAIYNLNDLNCTKSVHSDVRTTRNSCGNINSGSYFYDIGFRISRHNFLTVFRVCRNNATQSTLYSVHTLNGRAIKYHVRENKRRNFQTTGFAQGNRLKDSFNKIEQIDHFARILGNQQTYIDDQTYLAKGHLTPDADFIFPIHQLATYYYINVAPEFQSINTGNWKRVENLARSLASAYNTNFTIWTGTYDILKFPAANGIETKLYLDSGTIISVPKWFWKIIKNDKSDAGIVMITLNNPHAQYNQINEFCTNVCLDALIDTSHFDNLQKGYTFCCEIENFKRTVNYLPDNVSAKNLLIHKL